MRTRAGSSPLFRGRSCLVALTSLVAAGCGGTTTTSSDGGVVADAEVLADGAPEVVDAGPTPLGDAGLVMPDAATAIDAGASCARGSGEGVVQISAGSVRGIAAGTTTAYLGVPFADQPAPWRPPTPRTCWSGVREASSFPPVCLQRTFAGSTDDTGTVRGSEDCLAVNLWVPNAAATARPVFVYVHGGGNQQGSSSDEQAGAVLFEGDLLAARADAIVVTLQYRVGPFGYLNHPALADAEGHAGNYALLDQIAALRWVQENIGAFGGDPARVLLFGESGGAVDVCSLIASPLAAGLFSRAIVQSGACVATPEAEMEATSRELAAELGCGPDADRDCLEALAPTAWLDQIEAPIASGLVTSAWGATIDGHVLLDVPQSVIERGEHNHVALIVGSNAQEMSFFAPPGITPEMVRRTFLAFAPYDDELLEAYPPGTTSESARTAYVAATTDSQFTCTARRLARAAQASQTEPVFRYFFDHAIDTIAGRRLGAFHGLELFYVFGTIERSEFAPSLNETDRSIVALFGERWGAMARGGMPTGTPSWPAYGTDESVFVIDDAPHVEPAVRGSACDLWDLIRARGM